MVVYLLDSCICIDCMRGKLPYAYDLMRRSDPAQFKVPSIVLAELQVGVVKSQNSGKNQQLLDRFVEPLEVLSFDEECARVYGEVRGNMALSGVKIGANDLLIACMALRYNCRLATNNAKDFKRVPNLSFESWYEFEI